MKICIYLSPCHYWRPTHHLAYSGGFTIRSFMFNNGYLNWEKLYFIHTIDNIGFVDRFHSMCCLLHVLMGIMRTWRRIISIVFLNDKSVDKEHQETTLWGSFWTNRHIPQQEVAHSLVPGSGIARPCQRGSGGPTACWLPERHIYVCI